MPKVSVVISTYNRRAMLAVALASALGQRDVDHEVIVVDNGSTDETAAYLATLEDPRLVVIRNDESLGPTGGRNTGLRAARGEWVGFLDDDDVWAPDKLRRQLDAADADGASWAYCGCVYIDASRTIIGGEPPLVPERLVDVLPAAYAVPAGLSGMIWRRDALADDGLLDERLRWQTDWDLSLRLLGTGPPAFVSAPLVAYRQHGGQISQGAAAHEPELLLMQEKHRELRARANRQFDMGMQHRFLGSEALRAGQRWFAFRSYLRAIAAGDLGSLVRMLGLLLPRAAQPMARRRLLSDNGWLSEAQRWLDSAAIPAPTRRVAIVQRSLRTYREPFYVHLQRELARSSVQLELYHATTSIGGARRDEGVVPWAREVNAAEVEAFGGRLVRLDVWDRIRDADLVIVEQASRLLLNYRLWLARKLRVGPAWAYWGHGETLDDDSHPVGRWIKRALVRSADWWFGYTEGTARIVTGAGFPPERVTVVRNATDTTALAAAADAVTDDAREAARQELGLTSGRALLYLGSFSPRKGLPTLFAAADLLRDRDGDLELVFAGSGDLEDEVAAFCADRSWAHLAGLRFGDDLAALAANCAALVVPTWAGLVVVDAFALGLPVVIADEGPHPPEADYVIDQENGLRVVGGTDPATLAGALGALLDDHDLRARLSAGSRKHRSDYTIEVMADRFALGIQDALAAVGRPASRR